MYENNLRKEVAEKHPDLTPEQAKGYNKRIIQMVTEYRMNYAKRQAFQQQAPTPNHQRNVQRAVER